MSHKSKKKHLHQQKIFQAEIMAQCAAQWSEQPAGFAVSCVRPHRCLTHKISKVHDGEGALNTDLLRIKNGEGMTAINCLFFPRALLQTYLGMPSNLNCVVIAYVAFLSELFQQWNLISLLLPMVEFLAIWCGRNNIKCCVNKRDRRRLTFWCTKWEEPI